MTVIDVNDNSPKMDIPSTCITISEFHDVKDLIFVIKVKDADDPTTPNGRVKIRILSGNELGVHECFYRIILSNNRFTFNSEEIQ